MPCLVENPGRPAFSSGVMKLLEMIGGGRSEKSAVMGDCSWDAMNETKINKASSPSIIFWQCHIYHRIG